MFWSFLAESELLISRPKTVRCFLNFAMAWRNFVNWCKLSCFVTCKPLISVNLIFNLFYVFFFCLEILIRRFFKLKISASSEVSILSCFVAIKFWSWIFFLSWNFNSHSFAIETFVSNCISVLQFQLPFIFLLKTSIAAPVRYCKLILLFSCFPGKLQFLPWPVP